MPWNGLGQYILPPAFSPEINGTVVDATRYNGLTDDVADGITNALAKDGQSTAIANIPMGNFIFVGCGVPATVGDSLSWGRPASLGRVSTPSATVAASTIDCATGNYFYKTVAGALTWTFTNLPAAGEAYGFFLELANGGVGVQTWPASVRWQFGVAPVLRTAATDLLFFMTRDGGVTWRAALAIANTVT